MATLDTEDGNILDAEAVNWRRIVYPVVGFVIILLGGLSIYYYQQSQRDQQELEARQAIFQARTPEALRAVANQYPKTVQADFALLEAASLSLAQRDYAGAIQDYRRISDNARGDAMLGDSARVGLASALEASGKLDDAIQAYLTVAHRGKASPYAPFAYTSAARLYEQKGDKKNERQILNEAVALGGDSPFIKEAQYQLKMMEPASPASNDIAAAILKAATKSMTHPSPAASPTNSAPAR
jgi:predicted negative regulator of RcsB-dependent stress response